MSEKLEWSRGLNGERIFPTTDAGNAELFADHFGAAVRWDHSRGRWLLFGGHHWEPDQDSAILRMAKESARRRYLGALGFENLEERAAESKWAINSESRARMDSAIALAKAEHPIADRGQGWDADPWLIGVGNGLVNLRTGALRDGRPDDHVTLALEIHYDGDAGCPRWDQFMSEVFEGDADVIAFVQRAIGYTLTGSTREQCLFLLHGQGSNGKSVLLNTLRRLSGAYGSNLPFAALERDHRSVGGFDLAPLAGKRYVSSSETNEGARIDESRVKMLTGGDVVTAAFKYENAFSFVPVAKFWIAVNHLPNVADGTDSFWRRVRLIPFRRQFRGEDVDPELEDKIAAELPGIFNWAIAGCLRWQQGGLQPPRSVITATATYRESSDPLAAFLDEGCILTADGKVARATLYNAYLKWCSSSAIPEKERIGERTFGQRIGERFQNVKSHGTRAYRGITLAGAEEHAMTERGDGTPPILAGAEKHEMTEMGDATPPRGTLLDSDPSFSKEFFPTQFHVEKFQEIASLASPASPASPVSYVRSECSRCHLGVDARFTNPDGLCSPCASTKAVAG